MVAASPAPRPPDTIDMVAALVATSPELHEILRVELGDPRVDALAERVRRAFVMVHGVSAERALAGLAAGVDWMPTYSVAPGKQSTPRAPTGSPPEPFEGLLHAPRYSDGRIGYFEPRGVEPSVSELRDWATEDPSLVDLLNQLDLLEATVAVTVDDEEGRGRLEKACARIRTIAAKVWKDPEKRTPRARRALIRLADRLPGLFPELDPATCDEVVHLVGEKLGVASLKDEGTDPKDRREVRRKNVDQWRRTFARAPRTAANRRGK